MNKAMDRFRLKNKRSLVMKVMMKKRKMMVDKKESIIHLMNKYKIKLKNKKEKRKVKSKRRSNNTKIIMMNYFLQMNK